MSASRKYYSVHPSLDWSAQDPATPPYPGQTSTPLTETDTGPSANYEPQSGSPHPHSAGESSPHAIPYRPKAQSRSMPTLSHAPRPARTTNRAPHTSPSRLHP